MNLATARARAEIGFLTRVCLSMNGDLNSGIRDTHLVDLGDECVRRITELYDAACEEIEKAETQAAINASLAQDLQAKVAALEDEIANGKANGKANGNGAKRAKRV